MMDGKTQFALSRYSEDDLRTLRKILRNTKREYKISQVPYKWPRCAFADLADDIDNALRNVEDEMFDRDID